ncbi:MAG: T9SS type A sorting domain-containing protein [Bacteroidota bacterium]
MKNQLLLILIFVLMAKLLSAQTAYSLPFEANEPNELGVFRQYLFFSNGRPDENTDQLWQFDTQTKQFLRRSSDSTFLVDFQLTPKGVFWLEKDRNSRFSAGEVSLWFWSGELEQAPMLLQSTTVNNASLLDHSDDNLFLHFDISVLMVDLNTLDVQNLGAAPAPANEDRGIIWQGGYFWSVTGGTNSNQIYWADPEEGLQLFWQAERNVYNFIELGERLLWREGTRLVRYDWGSPGPEYYYEFQDWDTRISFLGEWFGASLNDSLYLFPAATETYGSELWCTDGTTKGTFLLKDIATEASGNFAPGSYPRYLHQNGGKIHFMAYTKLTEPQQHWESDGTPEGTILRSQSLGPNDRVNFGYPVNDSIYMLHLHSDLDGLEPVLFSDKLTFYDIHAGPSNSLGALFLPNSLSLKDGSLVIEAFTAENGMEPWILFPDQSQAQLADIAPYRAWSRGPILGEVDGMLYLIGGNVDQGYQIYELDPKEEVNIPTTDLPVHWQQNISPAILPSSFGTWVYSLGLVRGTDGSLYSSGSTNLSVGQLMFNKGMQPLLTQDLFADGYVARMDREGYAEWMLPLPGSFVASDAPLISEALEGGVYAGGRYFRSSQIGETAVLAGAGDNYLAKIDANGGEEWVKTLSLGGGEIFRLRTDSLGFLWAIGNYRNRASIDGVSLASGISPAYFVARWSPSGELQWAITLEPGIDWPSWGPVHAVNIDPSGNIWLFLNNMGHNYSAPCRFGTIYGRMVKLSSTGTVLLEQEWSGDDAWYATDLNFTAQGNVLLVGRFRGNLKLGNSSLEHRTAECTSTGFIAKIDPLGTPIRARSIENERIPEAVVANSDGTYALAGYQNLPERISYPGYTHFPFGRKQHRIFTSIYSSTDSLLAERNFLADEDFDQGGFIFLLPDSEDRWILQGEINDMLDTIGTVQPSFGGHYIYLMSFDLPYNLPEQNVDQGLLKGEIQVFPNPTTDYVIIQTEDMDFEKADIVLYNAKGQQLGQTLLQFEPQIYRMNLYGLPAGVYQLVVRIDDQVFSKPIYKSK